MSTLRIALDFPDLPGSRCTEQAPDVFFPSDSGSGYKQADTARTICAGCPVRELCLEWAVEHQVEHGIWGGLTAVERKPLMQARKRCRDCSTPIQSRFILCAPCREEHHLQRGRAAYARERSAA